MKGTRFVEAVLIAVIITGIFSGAPAISSLVDATIIRNTGRISVTEVTARSGSAVDIQAAIDVIAAKGGGTVHIPEGTFNFVEVGQSWMTVNIPAGVNLLGAPNQRDANGANMGWNTVLTMPYDVPGSDAVGIPTWFKINGNGDPSKPSRFSDIKLVGYRSIDASSTSMHTAIRIYGVVDFRIDHCSFLDTTAGIYVLAATANGPVRGVIDHNRLVNTNGYPGYGTNPDGESGYSSRTIDYGIMPARTSSSDYWDSDITHVVGQYTDYTVFIEDNYFSRWRHDVSSNHGMHYVFRHNVVADDYGAGTVDGHGTYTYVGTRAMEFYNNQFLDPNYIYEAQPNVVNWRGGGGVFFNNTIRDYYFISSFTDEGTVEKCWPGSSDCPVYFWENTYLHGGTHYDQPVFVANLHDGVHMDTPMPNYTSYPYPHPLTLEG